MASARVPLLPRTANSAPRPKPQPRDERVRIPGSDKRSRPPPVRTIRDPSQPILRAPPSSRASSGNSSRLPKSPEIVDIQDFKVPSRRHTPFRSASLEPPSQSPRQSEVSFDIIHYYIDRSPVQTPALPTKDAKVSDADIAAFDFGLSSAVPPTGRLSTIQQSPVPGLKAAPVNTPSSEQKRSYSLFPTVASNRNSNEPSPSSPHEQCKSLPHSTSRPRKSSLQTNCAPRTDSCTTIRLVPSSLTSPSCPQRPQPLRLPSASSPESPPSLRWSGDTVLSSPHSRDSALSNTFNTRDAGPSRVSAASSLRQSVPPTQFRRDRANSTAALLRNSSGQPTSGYSYDRNSAEPLFAVPISVWEDDDDDEAWGWTGKLRWRSPRSSTTASSGGRFGKRRGGVGRVVKRMLCCA